MSRDYCECPHCRRQFPVTWSWEATKFAYLDDTVGEVVTDSDCLDAMKVAYQRHVRCPHCGTRLRVEHELMPRFFESKEKPMTTSDGWHTEPPKDERLVLCQGKLGGFFVESYHKTNGGGMDFYVPNYRGGYRPAVAWHELPEPYGGGANAD